MLPKPLELREQSRRYREAALDATSAEDRQKLARFALALAQIAEQIDGNRGLDEKVLEVQRELYRQMLAEATDADQRRVIEALLEAPAATSDERGRTR